MAGSTQELWNAAAHGWDAGYDWYAQSIEPLTDWFCRSVGSEGGRVLDLACGTGLPALALAMRVGVRGRVVATDIAPAMVEVTRRRAKEAGLENLDAREMDAADLRFSARSFDAVTCACGLMFCPEPEKVVSEMRRALVPRGRTVIAVWDEPSKNPFFTVAGAALGSVLPSPPRDTSAPGPFRLSATGELEQVLRAGGFVEVCVERMAITFELESVDEYWRIFTEMAAGVAERVATLSDEDRARAREALYTGSEAFMTGGRLRLGASALCALARAP